MSNLGCGIFVSIMGCTRRNSWLMRRLIPSDVFNRYPDPTNLAHTVHIMKYIFPREFKLHNVFTSTVDTSQTAQPFKDYTMREEEIRASRHAAVHKIPKRLRGMLPRLISRMQKQYRQCACKELLEYYCPNKVASIIYHVPDTADPNCSVMMTY